MNKEIGRFRIRYNILFLSLFSSKTKPHAAIIVKPVIKNLVAIKSPKKRFAKKKNKIIFLDESPLLKK